MKDLPKLKYILYETVSPETIYLILASNHEKGRHMLFYELDVMQNIFGKRF